MDLVLCFLARDDGVKVGCEGRVRRNVESRPGVEGVERFSL